MEKERAKALSSYYIWNSIGCFGGQRTGYYQLGTMNGIAGFGSPEKPCGNTLIYLKNKTLKFLVDFFCWAWYYRQAVRETGREKSALSQMLSGTERKKALDKEKSRC